MCSLCMKCETSPINLVSADRGEWRKVGRCEQVWGKYELMGTIGLLIISISMRGWNG
jgi:hypothetical protein